MARPKEEMDLKTLVQKRYEELVNEKTGIEEELKGLEGYLKAVGETGTKAKAGRKVTAKLPYERRVVSREGRKTSATQAILSLIATSEKGISIDEIMKQTGLPRNTVNGVLNRMKKEKKVKAVRRGVYVKQNSAGSNGRKKQVLGKKAEVVAESAATPQKATRAKTKESSKRSTRAKKAKSAKKVPATETILSLVGKSESGISIDQIRKETGFGRLTVSGVLVRMKKAGKVKGVGKGVYAKA